MNPSELSEKIISHLPFEPLPQQAALIESIADYLLRHTKRDIFLLNGYAGSGKTSIMGALVRTLRECRVKSVTLAPTGRAAKVAAGFSGGKASTIHKRIFRPESNAPDARYFLAPNPDSDTVFIIDEASLIADTPGSRESLLRQMLKHIHSSEGNAVILVGDVAQLPPVGQSDAPAMNAGRLRRMGLYPREFTLDIPMRQGERSGILYNATRMRQLMLAPVEGMRPKLFARGFDDVEVLGSQDLADRLSESWSEVGQDETIIITRSNSRANRYNMAIRNQVMMAEEPLQRGDRLVISKNDYYWSKLNKEKTFIANGDMAEVQWVGSTEKMYGRFFTDVELFFPGSELRIGAKVMLRSLMTEGPSIPRQEMERFYQTVMREQTGEVSERIKSTLEDPYYNALQAKYGYCVTCHKAQGGQWAHVYIDMSGIDPEGLDENFYRWFYTAVTRATQKVFFINPTLEAE
ncbi:MAG: AAA family ATPase [Bacteroides sp.]|nr:AAA family ATPase [Bacteroides sp.]